MAQKSISDSHHAADITELLRSYYADKLEEEDGRTVDDQVALIQQLSALVATHDTYDYSYDIDLGKIAFFRFWLKQLAEDLDLTLEDMIVYGLNFMGEAEGATQPMSTANMETVARQLH